MHETIQHVLRDRAHDDTVAVRYGEHAWTWREHLAEAAAEASALIGMADPRRPLHVGVLLGNTPDMLRAMAAAALGGYVLCGLNTTRRGAGLLADIQRSDCQLLLVNPEHRALLEGLDTSNVTVLDVTSSEYLDAVGCAAPLVPHREVTAADPMMLIFTSGTTGNPKAVPFAHVMAVLSGSSLVLQLDVTPNDVCYLSMPLFHSNGVAGGWSVAVCSGATMVPARFSASRFLEDVRRYGATYMNYVGKPLALILGTRERPDDADNPLRVAFGNEAADRDIDEFATRFGCRVMDGFGSSEFAVIVVREDGTPPGSIGRGWDGVAVYHPDTVSECAAAVFDDTGALANFDDAVGELVNTTGGGAFGGYYNDPESTNERMRHGMYWSGDLAYRDVEGWIYLAGRTSDWMRVDGENLAAAPIERILLRCDRINQVAVYAVPDARVGDQVMAAVVLGDGQTLTPTEFTEFLAVQSDLSPKAWPRYVRINEVLPQTATNKILKRTLIGDGVAAGDGVLWEREDRGTTYAPAELSGYRREGAAGPTVGAILDLQRTAFVADGIPDLATRLDRVGRLQSMILDHTEELVAALAEDFGTRAREVSVLADVVGCMGDLEYQKKHLRSWLGPRSRGWLMGRFGLRQEIRHDPLGVVGVMGPWNFPVQLTMLPAGTALAAGNRVMVRPSEITVVTTKLLAALAAQYFPIEELAILTDASADGPTFAALEFDHLFFTGSPAVGALVAQAAGKNLVPVTLELGGKNPAVVDRSADLSRAAARIAASRMVNGGQVCMCPDYVLVAEESAEAFVTEVLRQWRKAFPDILTNDAYTSAVDDRHYDHVVGLIDDAVTLGATRVQHVPAGEALPDRGSRKIAPTILTNVPDDATVHREEIFGPVLVVHPYRELSDAIDYVNARPHPLTIYWYGADNDRYDHLQRATRSGSVNANDFTLNFIGSELPFGGVGRSGSGAYRGRAGFDTFTHARAVAFSRWPVSLARMMAPPFGRRDARLVDVQLAAFRRRNRRTGTSR